MSDNNPITAKFLTGSIPKHVITMTLSATMGLIGVFVVDLLDLYFLSLLGEAELAAAIGYAATITFFTTAVSIGFSIATGVLTARLVGAGRSDLAKIKFMSSVSLSCIISLLIILWLMPNLSNVLKFLGTSSITHAYALQYLTIVIPSFPFLVIAMVCSAALRGLGAGKNAMLVTLGGAAVNAILDPILIFGLEMGVAGAATATLVARVTMLIVGVYFLQKHYRFFIKISLRDCYRQSHEVLKYALPAILTNQATPFANAYVVASIADYGDSSVAGYAIISRLTPVIFALVFALSGAIGPIIGQHYGAKIYDRIKACVMFAYFFVALYVLFVWLLMMAILPWLIDMFNASAQAANLLSCFIKLVSLSFIFNGFLFVGNAIFNNLGRPFYSTIMNWFKATLGTIPFVYCGGILYQSEGILLGQALGNILFGLLSVWAVVVFIRKKLT